MSKDRPTIDRCGWNRRMNRQASARIRKVIFLAVDWLPVFEMLKFPPPCLLIVQNVKLLDVESSRIHSNFLAPNPQRIAKSRTEDPVEMLNNIFHLPADSRPSRRRRTWKNRTRSHGIQDHSCSIPDYPTKLVIHWRSISLITRERIINNVSFGISCFGIRNMWRMVGGVTAGTCFSFTRFDCFYTEKLTH